MIACYGNFNLVDNKILIEIGLGDSVNKFNKNGLIMACSNNKNVEIIKYLVEIEIDKNKLNIDGND